MQLKKLVPHSGYARITLALVVLQAIIVIILESLIFSEYSSYFYKKGINLAEERGRGIPIYLIIFSFSQVFQVVLIWDAITHQNTIQLIGFGISNLCCCVFSVFQVFQIKLSLNDASGKEISDATLVFESIKMKLIGVTIVTGATELLCLYLGFKLYKEFGWQIYKKIGADPHMKNIYRTYQIFILFIKLDFFFFLGFTLQFLVLVLHEGDIEYPLTIILIPLTLIILFIAVWSVRHESRTMMVVFLVTLACGFAYFGFKIVRMYMPDQKKKYQYTHMFLTSFAAISLAALIATFLNAVLCWRNFGKGLKQHLLHTSGAVVTETNISPYQRTMVIE
ncbi:uncharacterized protein VTP21DRAFT_3009 [Calcarisporiella thermophila]|uniref:uncharacterized protein n=1 Tax=Calcarisporiella thermophila TaxID=911321 RepID=UPI003743EC43